MSPSINFVLVLLLAACLAVIASAAPSPQAPACNAEKHLEFPCRCCKIDCWYTIASAATHELGHMPGQEGEAEALATLKLIRACMIEECSAACAMPFPLAPRQ